MIDLLEEDEEASPVMKVLWALPIEAGLKWSKLIWLSGERSIEPSL